MPILPIPSDCSTTTEGTTPPPNSSNDTGATTSPVLVVPTTPESDHPRRPMMRNLNFARASLMAVSLLAKAATSSGDKEETVLLPLDPRPHDAKETPTTLPSVPSLAAFADAPRFVPTRDVIPPHLKKRRKR